MSRTVLALSAVLASCGGPAPGVHNDELLQPRGAPQTKADLIIQLGWSYQMAKSPRAARVKLNGRYAPVIALALVSCAEQLPARYADVAAKDSACFTTVPPEYLQARGIWTLSWAISSHAFKDGKEITVLDVFSDEQSHRSVNRLLGRDYAESGFAFEKPGKQGVDLSAELKGWYIKHPDTCVEKYQAQGAFLVNMVVSVSKNGDDNG